MPNLHRRAGLMLTPALVALCLAATLRPAQAQPMPGPSENVGEGQVLDEEEEYTGKQPEPADKEEARPGGSGLTDDQAAKVGGGIIAALGVFWALWLALYGFMFLAMLALMGVWIWMLVDVVKRDFTGENDKLVWVLVVVLAGWIGALVYYFVVKRPADEAARAAAEAGATS